MNYESAYDSARNRHPDKGWPPLDWFDLWKKVFREESVVHQRVTFVRPQGYREGFILPRPHPDILERLSGRRAGRHGGCLILRDAEARERGLSSMKDIDLMVEITEYNEVDCRVMWEILAYLRAHH